MTEADAATYAGAIVATVASIIAWCAGYSVGRQAEERRHRWPRRVYVRRPDNPRICDVPIDIDEVIVTRPDR